MTMETDMQIQVLTDAMQNMEEKIVVLTQTMHDLHTAIKDMGNQVGWVNAKLKAQIKRIEKLEICARVGVKLEGNEENEDV